jgi:hypothetical protein
MFNVRDEGEPVELGFNVYPRGNKHSKGFILRLANWYLRVRYSLKLERWFISLRHSTA